VNSLGFISQQLKFNLWNNSRTENRSHCLIRVTNVGRDFFLVNDIWWVDFIIWSGVEDRNLLF
jgi:hypothetical protein